MALRLVELLVDRQAAKARQLMIEYDPEPPFNADGDLGKASEATRLPAFQLLKEPTPLISLIRGRCGSLSRLPTQATLLPRNPPRPHTTIGGDEVSMRPYEVMIILDPTLDERTVAPSLDTFLNVIRSDGGKVDKVDIWGRRGLAEIAKHPRASTRSSTSRLSLPPCPSSSSAQPERVGAADQGDADR